MPGLYVFPPIFKDFPLLSWLITSFSIVLIIYLVVRECVVASIYFDFKIGSFLDLVDPFDESRDFPPIVPSTRL